MIKDLGLSPYLSDGMVIQRDVRFPVWSRKKVSAAFLGKNYESENISGKWLFITEPAAAGGPFEMTIFCGQETLYLKDIYIGDVWLCAGQSNMEMPMLRLKDDFGDEWEIKDYPPIRHFAVPQIYNFIEPCDDISGGCWTVASANSLGGFSAAAWFFAKNMYEKYRVPIGLVNTAWGGTPVESWMSIEDLADYPLKISASKKNEEKSDIAIHDWESNLDLKDLGIIEEWQKQQTDISCWKYITLPGYFEQSEFCGSVWFAKDFESDADLKNAKVWLGTIVDADTVYINGKEIGSTAYRYPPRKYFADIKKGINRITIRVICRNGDCCVTKDKPFRIFSDNKTIELCGTWKYSIGASLKPRPLEIFPQRKPIGNYNAMIAPILKFPLKGVIWYQGESNEANPCEYENLFKLMINGWRQRYGCVLPFIFVQLPTFCPEAENNEQSRWAILREAQKQTLSLPDTGMACALELGEWNDIHPVNKKDVGFRLFMAADKTVFGAENSSPGPMFKNYVKKNKHIYLYFDNCAKGLKSITDDAFISVTENDITTRLPAVIIEPNCLFIDYSSVKNPKNILYAWADNPKDRAFFNSDVLPMIPFRITID
ncbi:MAG: sialate O-acetylesterase [Treponema sp.]|nr:sialate O-acetylesterase [Treponema sp.]